MPRIDTLFPDVYLLQSEVGGRPLQIPLLVGAERALLIDSGCAADPQKFILPSLRELGVPLSKLAFVVTTHCDFDHQGGNAALKQAAPHVLICCGDADRAAVESPQTVFTDRYNAYSSCHAHSYDEPTRAHIFSQLGAPQPVDLTFRGGERLRLGEGWEVEILHMPGHSHGHLGVWDKKNATVFGGDAIQGSVYLDMAGAAALCPTYLHIQPYRTTIARIEQLPLEGYVGTHWPVARGRAAVKAFCAESREFVERAEAAVLAAIRAAGSKGTTLKELCFAVGPSLGDWPQAVNHEMCYAFTGHLDDLRTRGLIHEHRTAVPYRYTSAA